ncbi:phage replisome organizer N-terminal domain-containing protein [Leptospirillum ferriphilum]|uniref:phage replisome organizer N-terminal domain-containing protein n=1 Tax=Leptospirillum ferriphilum TaxID=178606 RepID=UPI0006B1E0EE|nr:phage replisome organizer N-terminal domain-containing protein [Leptospirillum ferriphilum]
MKPYSWIKLSTDFFDDPKVLRLQTYPEKDFLLIFWIRIVLLSLRRNDGLLLIDDTIPYSVSDFVAMFRKDENVIRMALAIFEKLNMIVVQTTEYGETILGVSDFVGFVDVEGLEETRIGNRERQSKFRERQKLALAKASKKDNKTSESTDIEGDNKEYNALLTDGVGVTNDDQAVSNEKVTRQNRIEKIREEEKREENTSAPNDSKNESGSTHDTPREKTPTIDFDFSTGEFSNITEKHLQIWTKAYPAVDISTELQRMAAWLIANPKNRKSNYPRFITNWLTRAQDRSPSKHQGSSGNRKMTFSEIKRKRTSDAIDRVVSEMNSEPQEDSHGAISI